eukprot:6950861-Lingulodinium_polyedra.AAC.1
MGSPGEGTRVVPLGGPGRHRGPREAVRAKSVVAGAARPRPVAVATAGSGIGGRAARSRAAPFARRAGAREPVAV